MVQKYLNDFSHLYFYKLRKMIYGPNMKLYFIDLISEKENLKWKKLNKLRNKKLLNKIFKKYKSEL